MNGSIHQELIKDPSTCLQVGWVMALRQVSVISPSVRNHYLNITPGNVVAIYRLNKENEVTVSSWPFSDSSPFKHANSEHRSACPTVCWKELLKDCEDELLMARSHASPIVAKLSGSEQSHQGLPFSGVRNGPLPSGRLPASSPLFAVNVSAQRSSAMLSHSVGSTHISKAPASTSTLGGDDFPEDDNDMLSLCAETSFEDASTSEIKPVCDMNSTCDKAFHSSIPTPSPLHDQNKLKNVSTSHPTSSICASTGIQNKPFSFKSIGSGPKKDFSFKHTSCLSSPRCLSQTEITDDTGNSHKFPNKMEIYPGVETTSRVDLHIGRDSKVQLAANRPWSKENQNLGDDMFGQWNDDLSDELLSQLSEDF